MSLNRVRQYYDELPDLSWQGNSPSKYTKRSQITSDETDVPTTPVPYTGPMTRSRTAKAANS